MNKKKFLVYLLLILFTIPSYKLHADESMPDLYVGRVNINASNKDSVILNHYLKFDVGVLYNLELLLPEAVADNSISVKFEVYDYEKKLIDSQIATIASNMKTGTFTWNPAVYGRYTLKFNVDINNQIAEYNENNNQTEYVIDAVGGDFKTDFQILDVGFSDGGPGNTADGTLYYKIKLNIKCSATQPKAPSSYSTQFIISVNGKPTIMYTQGYDQKIGGFLNPENICFVDNAYLPYEKNKGINDTLTFKIDPENKIDETNEDNNIFIKNITVAPDQIQKTEIGTNNAEIKNIFQPTNISNSVLYNNLKGKIILKVETNGEAFYVHPVSKKLYYLSRPDNAFSIMREQGIGIKNVDLEKIPTGLDHLTGLDSDSDGLPDLFEDAVGTNKKVSDTDGDGYNDKDELGGNYNPKGQGKLNFDSNFLKGQKGRIFLQVETKGEAWYINPANSKRYFLGRPADAFQLMRNLGLGISNNDFNNMQK